MLPGHMMDRPLLISSLLRFAADYHGDTEIVSRTVEGPVHRYTWARAHARMGRLANALARLGAGPGDRVATLAWNGYRHLELYFAISSAGAVCHTVNPRLFDDQIVYILNHARDRFLFLDVTFLPTVERLADRLKTIEAYVLLADRGHMPATGLGNVLCYEELLAAENEHCDWPEFDENAAASLCYTSGTTGNPKGALYSHRSTVLHTLAICHPDNIAISSAEVVLPVVPMFHANAWGLPYACALSGTKLVLPGLRLEGEPVYELIDAEGVTLAAGVPTVWLGLLEYMRANGLGLPTRPRFLIGGSAAPLAMIRAFEEEFGCSVHHAWGMTEMSPVGTTGKLTPAQARLPRDDQWRRKMKQGRAIWGVDLKIVDDDGRHLPHDGKAFGELFVRGPWIASGYFEDEPASAAAIDGEGWFRTGDVATIDAEGTVHLVDRSKDVIKSGGEWISSIDLESVASAHPDLAQVAVIGLPHPKWAERPLLIAVPAAGKTPDRDGVLAFLDGKIAKWWLPDDVAFVDALPLTATGKVSKLQLRERFQDHRWPQDRAAAQ